MAKKIFLKKELDNDIKHEDEIEILDIVDENDNVIGQKTRGEVYDSGMHNFRAVNVFVENHNGEIWVLKRSEKKYPFPLGLDMSVSGHVHSGETYDDALQRELLEELGMDIRSVKCERLGYLSPYKDGVSAFMQVYRILSDTTPFFNPREFVEGFWGDPKNIIKRIDTGEPAKDDLVRLLKRFYV
jgi:isopentenyldiphosphate isomerase